MGDRISIQFEGEYGEKSIVAFEHWAGLTIIKDVEEYAAELNKRIPYDIKKNGRGPMDRREPCYVMPHFIAWYFIKHPRNSLYLGEDENAGDNSDNGHWIYNLVADGVTVAKWSHVRGECE